MQDEALEHFRRAAAAAAKPFIYLSAGVDNAVFVEALQMAGKAGTEALESWLEDQGVRNINAVNDAIRSAKPRYQKAGLAQPAGV